MDIFIAIYIILLSAGLGRFILERLNLKFNNFGEGLFHSLILGLGILAYFVYFVGLLKGIYTFNFILLLIVLSIALFKYISGIIKDISSTLNFSVFFNFSIFDKTILFFLIIISANTLLGALAPPTGQDSLAYRLAELKTFINNHKVFYIPYSRESLWPFLTEMLFLLGMVLKCDITAKLIAMSFGFIICLGIYTLSKNLLKDKSAALLSISIFLFTPAIFTQMTYCYVDIAMSAFGFAAVIAAYNFLNNKDTKWAILAGVYSGFLLSTKYITLLGIISIIIASVYYIIKSPHPIPLPRGAKEKQIIILSEVTKEKQIIPLPEGKRIKGEGTKLIKGLLYYLLFTFCFSFVWYLRAYLIKGNPFYPFFSSFFNSGWKTTTADIIGKKFSAIKLIKAPWDMVMFPERFGGEVIGIMYLLFLPLYFYAFKQNCRVILRSPDVTQEKKHTTFSFFTMFSFIYFILWFYVDPTVNRFVFPILPVLALITGISLFNISTTEKVSLSLRAPKRQNNSSLFSRYVSIIFLAAAFFSVCLSFYFNYDKYRVSMGFEKREDYLRRIERTYRLADFINKNLPQNAYILMIGEIRSYYLNRPYLHIRNFLLEEKKDVKNWTVNDFLDDMNKIKINYVLITEPRGNIQLDSSIEKYLKDRKLIFSYSFTGKNKHTDTYFLYQL